MVNDIYSWFFSQVRVTFLADSTLLYSGIAAGCGLFLVIVVIVTLCCLKRRRRRRSGEDILGRQVDRVTLDK